jgi:hypothetical protein
MTGVFHRLRLLWLVLLGLIVAATGSFAAASGYEGGDGCALAANRTASQIDGKKFDYLFGRATGRQHNLDRTNQNALEMKRLECRIRPKGTPCSARI